MKFETRREADIRRKREKRYSRIIFALAFIAIACIGVMVWNGKKDLEQKNVDYQKQIEELNAKVEEQQNKNDELKEYEKYMHTKKFIEDMAKDKFGMIYPDELVFRQKSTQK